MIILKHQLSTEFVENLGAKAKKSLEENGYTLVKSDSAGFRVQISSQNREVILTRQMGESPQNKNHYIFIKLLEIFSIQLMFLGLLYFLQLFT